MGRRGPAPKPTALRILHGDQARYINQNEPQPSAGLPEPPEDMNDQVRAVWDFMVKELGVMGLARRPDTHQLRAYCEAVVDHARACVYVDKGGILIPDKHNGSVRKNPAFVMKQLAARTMLIYAREFGLTPAARVHLMAEKVADNSLEAERLLS